MTDQPPLTAEYMAEAVRRGVNLLLPGVPEDVQVTAFEMTAPATGQRFRVTVEEIPAWTEGMDADLARIAGGGLETTIRWGDDTACDRCGCPLPAGAPAWPDGDGVTCADCAGGAAA